MYGLGLAVLCGRVDVEPEDRPLFILFALLIWRRSLQKKKGLEIDGC